MGSSIVNRFSSYARVPIYALITLAVVGIILLFPRSALGLSVSMNTLDANYPLGDTIPVNLTISLGAYDHLPSDSTVNVTVTGAQSTSFTGIPIGPGSFTKTSGTGTGKISTLTGTIAHTDVTKISAGGYGYGYGYKPSFAAGFGYGQGYGYGGGGGSITATMNLTHQILKYPTPIVLPELPATQAIMNPIALTGATVATQGTFSGAVFPDFQFVTDAWVPNTPYDAKARAMDLNPAGQISGNTTAGIVVDGFSGQNDVFAQMSMFGDYGFIETSWNFPGITGSTANDCPSNGCDLTQITGVTFVSNTQMVVTGGMTKADAFAALLTFSVSGGVIAGPQSNAWVKAIDLSGSFSAGRPGGTAWDSTNSKLLVSEFQADPFNEATIAKMSVSVSSPYLSVDSTYTTPLASAGFGGFEGLAYNSTSQNTYGVTTNDGYGGDVAYLEFTGTGNSIATHWPSNIPSGQQVGGIGIAEISGKQNMFMITMDTREIFKGEIKAGPAALSGSAFQNKPKSIDADPDTGKYYMIVEGQPSDTLAILKADGTQEATRALQTADANIGGASLVPAIANPASAIALWVADDYNRKVYQVSLSDGSEVSNTAINYPGYVNEIGGLAHRVVTTDGVSAVSLYAYERNSDSFYKIDTSNKIFAQSFFTSDPNYNDMIWAPFGANGASVVNVGGTDSLMVSKFSAIYQINLTTGALEQNYNLNGVYELNGLGSDGVGMLFAEQIWDGGKIVGGLLPGAAAVELTTCTAGTNCGNDGNYSITAGVTVNGSATNATAQTYEVDKLDSVVITVSSPAEGASFTSSPAAFSGTVNDPTVTAVTIVQGLSEGTLVGIPGGNDGKSTFSSAADQAQYTTSGLWKFTSDFPGFNASDNVVAYYGQNEDTGNPNFDTGATTTGLLKSPAVAISTGAKLKMGVWYSTEPGFDFDQKTLQFCVDGGSCTKFLTIVDMPSALFGGMGGGMGGGGGNMGGGGGNMGMNMPMITMAPSGFFGTPGEVYDGPAHIGKVVFVPMNRFEDGSKKLTKIEYSLDQFNGQTGRITIGFDSIDPWGNHDAGLVVDNLHVTGPITSGYSFSVTGKAWSGNVDIAEGENATTLSASSSTATGTSAGSLVVNTFLDTMAPAVTLSLVTSPTQISTQTVSGAFKELSPDSLYVLNNKKLVSTTKSFTDTTYSQFLGLAEGDNVIQVVLADKGGSSSSTYMMAASTAGATTLSLKTVGFLSAGTEIQIGVGDEVEFATVASVTGTTATLTAALSNAHDVNTSVQQAPALRTTTETIIGATSITLNDVTGLAAGDTIQVGANSAMEIATVSAVNSTTKVVTVSALTKVHDDAELVAESTTLTVAAAKDDVSIVVGDETGFAVGDTILIGTEMAIITEIDADNNVLDLNAALTTDAGFAVGINVTHAAAVDIIKVDTTAPVVSAKVVPILSDQTVRAGDPFFIVISAADATSGNAVDTGIASVTYVDSSNAALGTATTVANAGQVIVKKHSLGTFTPTGGSASTTSHVLMSSIPSGTSTGSYGVNISVLDGAGNTATGSTSITVVASLTDRSAYLREGFNFVGFPLIPTESSLATLLDDEVTNASTALATALGRTPKLSDVVETIQTWSGGPATGTGAGQFLTYTPGASNSLTDLAAFMGLLVKVRSTVTVGGTDYSVFDTAPDPSGAGSLVNVPIKWNVAGIFLNPGSTPPTKEMAAGFNLWTPHSQSAILFTNALRGALIGSGGEAAVSAITQVNRVDAVIDASSAGGFKTEVEQGFLSLFTSESLELMRAYWTYMLTDRTITP